MGAIFLDSWSITSHSVGGRHRHPPSTPLDGSSITPAIITVIDDVTWFRNRMRIVLGQRSPLGVAKDERAM